MKGISFTNSLIRILVGVKQTNVIIGNVEQTANAL